MTDKEQIIIDTNQCKYKDKYVNYCLAERDNIGESYTICTGTDCYFKQLARKPQEYQKLADILRATYTYSRVCSSCKDEILIYPSISGKTSYTDNEVDIITLKKIINALENKTQECEELKEILNNPEHRVALTDVRTSEREVWWELGSKADRYRKALEEIENFTKKHCDFYCEHNRILDIINKVDFGKSERSETRPGESCVEPVEPPIIQEAKGE